MIKFKKIRVYPSTWNLDVIISKDKAKVPEIYHKKYGGAVNYYKEECLMNSCSTFNSTPKSETKGQRITIIWIETKKQSLVIHELLHAIWQISNNIGYEMSYDTQEWQAILLEYLYTEIMKDDYKTIK